MLISRRRKEPPNSVPITLRWAALGVETLGLAAKVLIFTDAAKYPRHIFKIRTDGQVCCQIRDSQRVISLKNRHFRPFLPYFRAVS